MRLDFLSLYIALHTTDGGATWQEQPGVVGVQDANEIYVLSSSLIWEACDNTGFWPTDGGGNWDSQVMGPFTRASAW